MKKTLIVILIVSAIAAAALCGCRPRSTLPGVTALVSAMPTVSLATPSPVGTTGTVSTLPVATVTAGTASALPTATK